MDKMVQENLSSVGIEWEEGIKRVNGSEELYFKLLKKFTADQSYRQFMDAVERHDVQQALGGVHALKGLCANLGMMWLYQDCVRIEQLMKQGQDPGDLIELKDNYARVIEAIHKIEST